jgi:ectoine hydroxylase-related dioxygenase (phytanoyl-CoA dioxygenase family)
MLGLDGNLTGVTATTHLGPNATVDEIVDGLERDGYAIIENVLGSEEVADIRAELYRLLEGVPTGRNAFEGFKTRRIYAVFGKTRALDGCAMHPLVLGALDHLLGPDYQLSGPTGIEILPGEVAQVLHRDEDIYPIPRPHQEVVTNVMWAFDDFTQANGATQLLRGSHTSQGPQAPDIPVTYAEMPAGSVMIYRGSVWHGGGANRTDKPRLGVPIEYAVGWLRQQETQLLIVPPEKARDLPERLQRLLGYNFYPPFLGYVDGRDPKRLLSR